MANSDYAHVTGASELTDALRQISDAVRSDVLAAGLREVVKPVLISAKRYARRSERTGALQESLTTKVINYPSNGKAVGLVGPDKSYYRKGKKVSRNVASFAGADRPANYAHLIEYGHRAVAPKKGATIRKKTAKVSGWVPAKPFLRPAVLTTRSEQGAAFYRGIQKGFASAVRKAGGKD
jgi:hypothetical protein